MGKPYSLDLRERIVEYVAEEHAARAAARVFGVSASTAVRLAAAHRRDGTIAAKPQGRAPGTAGKLAAHMDFLVGKVKSKPDITLQELADALSETRGVAVQLSSIHRALVRTGYSYKKGLAAQEGDRLDVRAARQLWITRRQEHMRAEPLSTNEDRIVCSRRRGERPLDHDVVTPVVPEIAGAGEALDTAPDELREAPVAIAVGRRTEIVAADNLRRPYRLVPTSNW